MSKASAEWVDLKFKEQRTYLLKLAQDAGYVAGHSPSEQNTYVELYRESAACILPTILQEIDNMEKKIEEKETNFKKEETREDGITKTGVSPFIGAVYLTQKDEPICVVQVSPNFARAQTESDEDGRFTSYTEKKEWFKHLPFVKNIDDAMFLMEEFIVHESIEEGYKSRNEEICVQAMMENE